MLRLPRLSRIARLAPSIFEVRNRGPIRRDTCAGFHRCGQRAHNHLALRFRQCDLHRHGPCPWTDTTDAMIALHPQQGLGLINTNNISSLRACANDPYGPGRMACSRMSDGPLPPPTLSERGHRRFARRLVAAGSFRAGGNGCAVTSPDASSCRTPASRLRVSVRSRAPPGDVAVVAAPHIEQSGAGKARVFVNRNPESTCRLLREWLQLILQSSSQSGSLSDLSSDMPFARPSPGGGAALQ
jgi:hypothetical protein